ncbi:hypothetical protein [Pseudoalteromonas denitrificans]|uniref:Uncharacterized protein n=1 Tax=Pseudoalteromonas denitrificans DSM 6059 TaxID=1123010 RepID=A0A1I1UMB6_9GAMM|nr:hypothetical protein [Pseudoalteromonas denitrificans]SFD71936.1 hypothetical protein SAMN02745724_05279 [Pseudoalteromonas denitrificans DSM 6059]
MLKLKFTKLVCCSCMLWGVSTSVNAQNDLQYLKQKVASWVTDKVIELKELNCDNTGINSFQCEKEAIRFSDGRFNPAKLDPNQTILILDDGLEFSSTVRYRSRIKAAYEQMNDGFYHQAEQGDYDPEFNLPLLAINTLREIDQFTDENSNETFIPALWLSQLKPEMERLYPASDNYSQYLDHGKMPLLYLLEHNPKAELVIASAPDFFKQKHTLFCQPDKIEEDQQSTNLVRLEQHIFEAADAFKTEVINGQNINYINYSGGYTLNTVKSDWNKFCKTNLPSNQTLKALLNTIRPFYDVLFNSEGVFAFQASDVNMTTTNNVLDIDKNYKNRMLVGDFTILDSELPEDGAFSYWKRPPELLYNRNNSKRWIDIFINFGIIEVRPFPYNETPLMNTHPLGLNSLPISSMQPSWAAPVALSRAIHLKNTIFIDKGLTNDLIIEMKNKMTPNNCSYQGWSYYRDYNGTCKLQDPLLHRQHEVYRLRYLE